MMKYRLVNILFIAGFCFTCGVFISLTLSSRDKHEAGFRENYNIYSVELPSKMDFAGEPVPLHIQDVRERMNRELLVNTYWQSQTLLFFQRANRWFPVIEPVLKKNGIPDDFKFLPLIESEFLQKTSPSGAVGFWQFLEKTAQIYGLEVNDEVDERYHIVKSTEAACRYLNSAYRTFGSWTLAAASYNMGIYGVKRQLERQKVHSYYDLLLNSETRRYVFRILAVKDIMNHPKNYGFHILDEHLYAPYKTFSVFIDTSVVDFADFAFSYNINYKELKIHNTWLRESYLKNKDRKVYEILIPIKGKSEPDAIQECIIYKSLIENDLILFAEDSLVIHTVAKDENIFHIARKYQVKIPQIMQWNNLGDHYVKRGQKLQIYLPKQYKTKEE